MSNEQIACFVAGLVVLVAMQFLRKPRRPKHTHFTCQRCNTVARFDHRTIRAWRAGKDRFFCATCHRKWLQTHPGPKRDMPMPSSRGGNRGCLGIILAAAAMPGLAWALRTIF